MRPTRRTVPLLLAALLAGAVPARAEPAACPDTYVAKGRVAAVEPAGDLVLADGSVLRLAGLWLADMVADPAPLEQLVLGRDVELAAGGAAADRYGRLAGMVRLSGTSERLQDILLGRGLAAARPEAGFPGCMASLLAAERPAREAGRGLWAGLPLDARNVAAIRAREGRFTIVAGRVLGVGNTRTVGYLNFGPVWRQDMTGRLETPARIALEARGMAPAELAGRRVTLRGTVLEAGGPAIDLRLAEQIEWDGAAAEDTATEDMRRTGER